MYTKKLSKILYITSILILITISSNLVMAADDFREDPVGEKISTSSVEVDSDNDLVPDDIEKILGTNSGNADTDGDGMWDVYEILCGTPNGGWQDPLIYNERYAVLIVGGVRKAENHGNYWNELVMTYDTLIEGYGYKPENVFVFYADGDTPNKDNMLWVDRCLVQFGSIASHRNMIDFDASKDTILNFLAYELTAKMTIDDSLFFWVYDHGTSKDNKYAGICCWEYSVGCDYRLYDYELYHYLNMSKYAQATFVLGTCISGGFLDPKFTPNVITLRDDKNYYYNLNDLDGRIIVMTSQDARASHSWYYLGFLYRFHQAISPRSLIGKPNFWSLMTRTAWYNLGFYTLTTPDKDRNRFVSMGEAFEYAKNNDDFVEPHFLAYIYLFNGYDYGDVPQYYESSDGLGYRTYL